MLDRLYRPNYLTGLKLHELHQANSGVLHRNTSGSIKILLFYTEYKQSRKMRCAAPFHRTAAS